MSKSDGEFTSSGTPAETDPKHSSAPANAALDADIVDTDRPCANCGYNLRGLGIDGVCPECGTPISFSLSELPAFVRKPKVDVPLERDTPCVCCGNVLRMQTTHGICSSCSAPVWYSLYGTWLRTSDPGWLLRVRSGVTLWLIVIVGGFVLGCVFGLGIVAWAISTGAGRNMPYLEALGGAMGSTFGLIILLCNLAITDRLLTPHPASAGLPGADRPRNAVRLCFLIGFVGVLAASSAQIHSLPSWIALAAVSVGLVGVAAHMGLVHQVRKLAARVPDRKMEQSALIVMWGYGLGQGVLQLMSSVTALAGAGSGLPATAAPNPPPAISLVLCSGGVAALAFTIWLIVLLSRLHSVLSRTIQSVEADRTVAEEPLS